MTNLDDHGDPSDLGSIREYVCSGCSQHESLDNLIDLGDLRYFDNVNNLLYLCDLLDSGRPVTYVCQDGPRYT